MIPNDIIKHITQGQKETSIITQISKREVTQQERQKIVDAREAALFGEERFDKTSMRLLRRSTEKEVLSSWNRSIGQLQTLNMPSEEYVDNWLFYKTMKVAHKHNWLYNELTQLIDNHKLC